MASATRAQPMHPTQISASLCLRNWLESTETIRFMHSPVSRQTAAARLDRLLTPIHRWIWRDHDRRVQKLLRFGETETDGGRDLLRAAELTPDPLLRRLYLVHATDEQRHGVLFRRRAAAMLRARPQRQTMTIADPSATSGHGLDDLEVDQE